MENTILAGKLVNGYHRCNGVKKITMKVDIANDFDSLGFPFQLFGRPSHPSSASTLVAFMCLHYQLHDWV